MRVRQLLYVSRADPSGKCADIEGILDRSRHNNTRDAITGLLWTDTYRFLQVLEGEEEKVGDCFARIRRDPRHGDIVLLLDTDVRERQFGNWSMERRSANERADESDARMRALLRSAAPNVAGLFLDLISTREAA